MVAIRLHPDHATGVLTAITSLTKSHIGGSAQVSTWPGVFVASNGSLRTQQVGTRITFQHGPGTDYLLVQFEDPGYAARNARGEGWIPRLGYWRARRTVNGVVGSWVDGLRPSVGAALAFHDVDPTATTRWEIEPHQPTDARNLTTAFEVWREPESFPGTEQGAWQQIKGFVTAPGVTFGTVTYTQPALPGVIFTDSNSQVVEPANDGTDLIVAEATGPLATTLRGRGGSSVIWWRQIIDQWCEDNGYRPVLHMPSSGGLFWGTMTDASRVALLSVLPSYPSDVIRRVGKITGYSTGAGTMGDPFVYVGRDNPMSFLPAFVISAMITNDMGFENQGFSELGGTSQKNATEAIVADALSRWSGVKIYAANSHLPVLGASTAKQGFAAAFTSGGAYDGHADVTYVDLNALEPNAANGSGHMTKAQHDLLVAAAGPTLISLLDSTTPYVPALRFNDARNSMYAAGAFPG